jgi:chorismate mutase
VSRAWRRVAPCWAAVAGGESGVKFKVSYDALADIYDRIVTPLTKDVQVAYLLRRLDGEAGTA